LFIKLLRRELSLCEPLRPNWLNLAKAFSSAPPDPDDFETTLTGDEGSDLIVSGLTSPEARGLDLLSEAESDELDLKLLSSGFNGDTTSLIGDFSTSDFGESFAVTASSVEETLGTEGDTPLVIILRGKGAPLRLSSALPKPGVGRGNDSFGSSDTFGVASFETSFFPTTLSESRTGTFGLLNAAA
jgi:hypothetical protein